VGGTGDDRDPPGGPSDEPPPTEASGGGAGSGGQPPAGEPPPAAPAPPAAAAGASGKPPRERRRARTAFGAGGWVRRLTKLWGFLGFCILVVVLARHVILPFVFAMLIAYILAPVVQRMSVRRSGSKRMPKGLAIIICYLVLLAAIAGFMLVLMPRLSKDAARIGREAPQLYKRLNDHWAPQVGRWLEARFPSLAPVAEEPAAGPVVPDVPLPRGTSVVVTPLPDGRFALQLQPGGVEVQPKPGGGFLVVPNEQRQEPLRVEDKIRAWAKRALGGLQSELGDVFRFSRNLIAGFARGIFTFFLVLMVAAFILIDLEKIHEFARSLIPVQYQDDYDVIVRGIDRGLSGVIRGQLLICLVNGCLTYVGLLIFDIKYSLILAVLAAILSLIPIFGSILSTIPIVLASLVSGDEGVDIARAVFMVGWVVGIHFIEANFLNPKIIGTAAKIHPVLVIFALIVGEHSYGLVGALLAVPVASIIQVLFMFFRRKAWREEMPDSARPITLSDT
jgi:predicted PurR-regulated permease PerM